MKEWYKGKAGPIAERSFIRSMLTVDGRRRRHRPFLGRRQPAFFNLPFITWSTSTAFFNLVNVDLPFSTYLFQTGRRRPAFSTWSTSTCLFLTGRRPSRRPSRRSTLVDIHFTALFITPFLQCKDDNRIRIVIRLWQAPSFLSGSSLHNIVFKFFLLL